MQQKPRESKITAEIRAFIDSQIGGKERPSYSELVSEIASRFGVHICKATISKRAKALRLEFRPGRKRLAPLEKRPAHSTFLDCAGAVFLKGAELELGLR